MQKRSFLFRFLLLHVLAKCCFDCCLPMFVWMQKCWMKNVVSYKMGIIFTSTRTKENDKLVFPRKNLMKNCVLFFSVLFLFYIIYSIQNQISWIRRRDWHILSSGAQLYTNDERFVISHTPGSNTWTLQIKFVQRRDHGMYECQVSIKLDKIK